MWIVVVAIDENADCKQHRLGIYDFLRNLHLKKIKAFQLKLVAPQKERTVFNVEKCSDVSLAITTYSGRMRRRDP